ncbi:MAG TPA: hypothetical protein VJV76_04315 [Gaiellaceae bacterium]|nr:hypothetical protein [Gaiellaceae bacterium]
MSSAPGISLSSTTRSRRLEHLGKPFVIGALGGLAVLAVAGVGWRLSSYPFGYFTRDPAATTHQAPYLGMVSFFGLFAWAVAATALLCGGYVASLRGASDRRTALFTGAGVVVYLLFDDAFQLHEYFYPQYLHVPDTVVELAYVAAVVLLAVRGRRFLASTNLTLLLAAGGFLALSIGLDVLIASERVIAVEDGSKLIGIFLLAAYGVDTALAESRLTFRQFGLSGGDPARG